MNSIHINIKNMVCNRCIRVVKEELEKINLVIEDIQLGEATVASENNIDLEKIKTVLENSGFELLEDKNVRLIERIKTLVIDLIHHKKGERANKNYSEIISKEVGKDYHYLSNLFSSIENITIEKFIILQKIERVKELLIYDELTLSEISFRMDYSSVAHLSAQFKQVTGLSPTEFKKLKNRNRRPLDEL